TSSASRKSFPRNSLCGRGAAAGARSVAGGRPMKVSRVRVPAKRQSTNSATAKVWPSRRASSKEQRSKRVPSGRMRRRSAASNRQARKTLRGRVAKRGWKRRSRARPRKSQAMKVQPARSNRSKRARRKSTCVRTARPRAMTASSAGRRSSAKSLSFGRYPVTSSRERGSPAGRGMRKLIALSLLLVLAVAACAPSTSTGPSSGTPAKKTVLRLPEGAKITNTMDPGVSSGGNGLEAFGTGKGTAEGMAAQATDDKTFVVTLERPAPFFMHLVATWTAYPVRKDMIEKAADKWTLGPDTYISNGHYRLVEWKPEQSMTVEKNPNYWGENNGPDTVVWTLLDDQAAKSPVAYEAGELDRAVLVGADITRARNDATLSKEVKKFERQGSQWIILDTTSPPLNNLKVRQALSLATNAKQLNEVVLKDAYFNAVSIVAPGVPGQKKENALGYDSAKAKQLMTEAGYPDGKGWPANVKFTFVGDLAQDKAIAEAV